MGTTADKLNAIIQTKANIKTAIENKGIAVGNVSFSEYSNLIASIVNTSDLQNYLDDQNLSYLQDYLLRAVITSAEAQSPTKTGNEVVGAGACFINGSLPLTTSVSYQKGLLSIRNVDFSGYNFSSNIFQKDINLYEVIGISTADSGEGITDMSSLQNAGSMFDATGILNMKIYLPIVTLMNGCFGNCSRLKTATIKTESQNITNSNYLFGNCVSLEEVTFINEYNIAGYTSGLLQLFRDCVNLHTVNGIINVSGCTNLGSTLDSMGARNIVNIRLKGLSSSIWIYSKNITKDSILYMFNNAATVSKQSFNIRDVVYDTLTDAEKQIATDKGWSVVRYIV